MLSSYIVAKTIHVKVPSQNIEVKTKRSYVNDPLRRVGEKLIFSSASQKHLYDFQFLLFVFISFFIL